MKTKNRRRKVWGLLFCITALILFEKSATANIRFQINTSNQDKELFLVTVRTSHYSFHSTTGKNIASVILPSNQSHLITVFFTSPLFYKNVYVGYYNPEYLHAIETNEKLPFFLRTVTFPDFQPQTYLDYLASDKGLRNSPPGIIGAIRDHFYYFIDAYLPELDKLNEDQEKELDRYQTLFQELSEYAETTLNTNTHSYSERYEQLRQKDGNYAMNLKRHEKRLFKELSQYLRTINWLLSLSRVERNEYRHLEVQLKKPKEYIQSILTPDDRAMIYSFLDQYLKSRTNKDLEKQIAWTNEQTKISYTLIHNSRFTRRKNKALYPCFKNALQIDLGQLYPATFPNLNPNLALYYCHIPARGWTLD